MRCRVLVAVIAFAGCNSLVTRIPPDAMTNSTIMSTEYRMGMYVDKAAALPSSLDQLPIREGYNNEIVDGWNRPLIYEVDDSGFSLVSLGRDGVVGGSGLDADITKKYRLVAGKIEEAD